MQKILFVGNSYTYYNDMPQAAFARAASERGLEVEVSAVTRGGYRLCQFADPENEEGKRLREVIAGQRYDCAVLQEQSLNPIVNKAQFLAGVEALKALIDADRFLLYATWGRNDESPQLEELGLSREQMTEQLSAAYHEAAALCGAEVAEVGKAFLAYAAQHDRNELYNPDHSHPSALGSEIAARVILEQVAK